MLSTTLIERALALTGKTMEDIEDTKTIDHGEYGHEPFQVFSMEKFCYFLLSPEFVEKFDYMDGIQWGGEFIAQKLGVAIYEYQSGNEKPLVELLTKI